MFTLVTPPHFTKLSESGSSDTILLLKALSFQAGCLGLLAPRLDLKPMSLPDVLKLGGGMSTGFFFFCFRFDFWNCTLRSILVPPGWNSFKVLKTVAAASLESKERKAKPRCSPLGEQGMVEETTGTVTDLWRDSSIIVSGVVVGRSGKETCSVRDVSPMAGGENKTNLKCEGPESMLLFVLKSQIFHTQCEPKPSLS